MCLRLTLHNRELNTSFNKKNTKEKITHFQNNNCATFMMLGYKHKNN